MIFGYSLCENDSKRSRKKLKKINLVSRKNARQKIKFTFSLVWRNFPPAKGLIGLKKVQFFGHWKLDTLPHLVLKMVVVFCPKCWRNFHFSMEHFCFRRRFPQIIGFIADCCAFDHSGIFSNYWEHKGNSCRQPSILLCGARGVVGRFLGGQRLQLSMCCITNL